MATRTIRHAEFSWVEDGIRHSAFRGDEVDLPDDAVEFGEQHGAFVTPDLQLVPPVVETGPTYGAVVPPPPAENPDPGTFPASGDSDEQLEWVAAHNVDVVVDIAEQHPEHTEALLAAEEGRGEKARTTLVERLEAILNRD